MKTVLEGIMRVRVVEIEGHDLAACVMDHAANLEECGPS